MNIAVGAVSTHRAQILLVEDDPAVRRSIQLLLHSKGFDVRAYANGAMLLADRTNAGAICFIADYRMDEMDGITVLTRLRERGWTGPSILITAFSDRDLTQHAQEAGFDAVFEKPLRPHALVDAVTRLTQPGRTA
ncbi:hypothetical protein BH10PSE12_BH10PSE12_11970 [soil metagenome]